MDGRWVFYRHRSRSGASDLGIVVLAVAVVALVLAGWFAWNTALQVSPEPSTVPGPGTAPEEPVGQGTADLQDPEGLRNHSPIETGLDREALHMEKSFEGRGQLTGYVEFAPGLPTPSQWTLEVLPSQFSLGRETAEPRVLELEGAIQNFEVFDLPMGGYTVRASASGMSSPGVEVMLYKLADRPELPGVDHVHLALHMVPRASVEGAVYTHLGDPAEDVLVTLQRPGYPERREVRTSYNGRWKLHDLEEGTWVARFGPYTRPHVEGVEVEVARPSSQAADVGLPPLWPLYLRVVDERDTPVEGALVRGWGPSPIEEQTGFDGQLRLEHLPEGTYQIRAEDPTTGQSGRLDLVVRPLEFGEQPLLNLLRVRRRD